MAASDHDSGDERESPPPAPPSGPAKFEPPTIRKGGAPVSCFQGPTVHIEVGVAPDIIQLLVHEKLLCRYSVFFRTALKGKFKEAKTKTMFLPDDDPYLFPLVVRWLYTGEIEGELSVPTPSEMDAFRALPEDEEESEDDDDSENEVNFFLYQLVNLWVLGDKYQMPALQNAATRGLVEQMVEMHGSWYAGKDFPEAALVEHVHANTVAGSPLRSLIVDMTILSRKQERVRSIMDTASPEMVLAFAKRSFHFWMAAGSTISSSYEQMRSCWKDYGVGTNVTEKDLFPPSACPPAKFCNRGPRGKPCNHCNFCLEEMMKEQQSRGEWYNGTVPLP